LKEDRPVVIQGKVTEDQFSGGLRVRAERIFDLTTARSRFARLVRLSMNGNASAAGAQSASRLKKLLEPYRNGTCPVAIQYDNGGASVEMRLPDEWRVSPDDALLAELRNWLRPENVEVLFS
jgi:DNA polymerase-3 subunit alpha